MKNFVAVTILSTLFAASAALAQFGADPNIVSPVAMSTKPPAGLKQLPYRFVDQPQPMSGQKFGNVSAVALTPKGNLLVYNRNAAMMMVEYDPSGKFIRTFNPNIAINTHGMRVDRHGNIWVTDSFLNVVWKLKPNGEPAMAVGARGEVAKWDDTKWNGMFNQPMDIAFDKDDNFYVVQGHGGTSSPGACTWCATYNNIVPPVTQGSDPRVFKFDKNGKYVSSLALPHADGTYGTIHSAIVTTKGELWVTDRQLGKIIVLDTNLKRLREISQPNLTSGLFMDAKGTIWLSSGMDGLIFQLDAVGKMIGYHGNPGRDNPNAQAAGRSDLIGESHYLAVTPDQKTIYIADSINGKVLRLERN